MLDLPWELVEEILSRVPATSLMRRLRFTCKRWNALFKDPKFIKNHLEKTPKENMVLMFSDFRVCSMTVNLDNNVVDPSTLDDFPNSEELEIDRIFQCDGFLLCTTSEYSRLVVWNPCTEQTRWIQFSSSRFENKCNFVFSLGYEENKSCQKSYKILKYSWDPRNSYKRVSEYEIYDFSSDSWTDLSEFAPKNCIIESYGVSLKGNTYWLAWENPQELLLTFDFSTERFTFMCLEFPSYSTEALSVVKEERLSVLCTGMELEKIEIWMTRDDHKIDHTKVLSWSKFLSVDIHCNLHQSLFSIKTSFFIDEEKKTVVLYSCKKGHGIRSWRGWCIHGNPIRRIWIHRIRSTYFQLCSKLGIRIDQ